MLLFGLDEMGQMLSVIHGVEDRLILHLQTLLIALFNEAEEVKDA